MANIDNEATPSHDYSAISPSAYALLMMKGHTDIPFAREAAALLENANKGQEMFTSDFGLGSPANYWITVMHFESRYWSIDQLLEDQPYTNILELSSGFSFRGLALSRRQPVFYIDTDLEGVIAGKQRFVDALTAGAGNYPGTGGPTRDAPGHYELQPLNVLDPAAFKKIIARFPPGPIAIVNEGAPRLSRQRRKRNPLPKHPRLPPRPRRVLDHRRYLPATAGHRPHHLAERVLSRVA